ncbi:MAG: Ppx/GppA family phosphatase [Nitrospiraceae bacterium]|nr:MAG: Ppx/GppA family phosphatase [Nitrospiraceae bacterium]
MVKNNIRAAIDIGTNTFRLLIAEVYPAGSYSGFSFRTIHTDRIITRLGEGVSINGLMSDAAMKRGIDALKKFTEVIARHHAFRTSAAATSVLRNAENRDEFLRLVRESTGLEIEVISGRREAEITAQGMLLDIPFTESALMIDIGGGSTELICMTDGHMSITESLDLGVVYLANKYMHNDPPDRESLQHMEDEVTGKIDHAAGLFKPLITCDTAFTGTAGTVTALAAMAQGLKVFKHDKIHKYKLHMDTVRNIFTLISGLSSGERAQYIPFELARLDIIVPGTLILLKLMESYGSNELIVSNYGLLEGILIDLCKKERKE